MYSVPLQTASEEAERGFIEHVVERRNGAMRRSAAPQRATNIPMAPAACDGRTFRNIRKQPYSQAFVARDDRTFCNIGKIAIPMASVARFVRDGRMFRSIRKKLIPKRSSHCSQHNKKEHIFPLRPSRAKVALFAA